MLLTFKQYLPSAKDNEHDLFGGSNGMAIPSNGSPHCQEHTIRASPRASRRDKLSAVDKINELTRLLESSRSENARLAKDLEDTQADKVNRGQGWWRWFVMTSRER
jgi:hypothetical protein